MYGRQLDYCSRVCDSVSIESTTSKLLDEFRSRPTLRAGSLIVTVFGDAIAPRGGTVWIGSLIKVLADFGINERLVRTSVFRLCKDGWLTVSKVGRRSYYSLTMDGVRKFEQATLRIYGEPGQTWAGKWCLVLLADLDADEKEQLRKELGWLGFAPISSNVLAHPTPNMRALDGVLDTSASNDRIVVMEGQTLGRSRDDAMRSLVHARWNLADLDERYLDFVARFRPVLGALRKQRRCDPRRAFLIRTLMIQEYRRILLRDPLLPAELLPPAWHGTAAYQLCRNLYRLVGAPADTWLSEMLETADGPLPPPAAEFFTRFGGLSFNGVLKLS